ncbi:MAG: SulP family inorganic anion transporter [Bacteroidia bacterium]
MALPLAWWRPCWTVLAGWAAFSAVCLAVMLAGGIQLLLGIARLGALASYFPTSVIKGMLAAIGLIIILKQIPHMVGLDSDYEGDFNFFQADGHNTFSEFLYLLDALTPGAVLIAVIGLALMVVWNQKFIQQNKVLSLIPGPLLAVIAGIVLQVVFERTGSSLALAPEHLIQIKASSNPVEWVALPDWGRISDGGVWKYAVIIAVIASVESLLCAEATDKMDPEMRVSNKNRELLAQGAGNMLSGLVGGLPVTQVIVRSSANVQAGARSRMSTIIHGLLILLTVVAFPGVLNEIPMASLAAVLILVGYNLTKPAIVLKYYRKGWTQFLPFIATIIAVLLSDLLIGVGVGVAVALFFILRRSFRAPYSYQFAKREADKEITIKLANIVSFMNKGVIVQTLQMIPKGSSVVIDATECDMIDPDVVEVIEDWMRKAASLNISVKIRGTLDHDPVVKNPAKSLRSELKRA